MDFNINYGMTKAYKLFTALICLLAFCGCEDSRDKFMVNDMVGYSRSYGAIKVSVFDEKFIISLNKSGRGRSSADVTISQADTSLENYNRKLSMSNPSHIDIKPLNPGLYKLSEQKFHFAKSDTRKTIEAAWSASEFIDAIAGEAKAIPLKLFSNGTAVNNERDLLIICPVNPSIGMDAEMAPSMKASLDITKKETASASISIDMPVKSQDIDIVLSIDRSLVSVYNSSHGTNYEEAPEGLISLENSSLSLKKGESKVSFSYVLDMSKFYKDGVLVPFSSFLVPITMRSVSLKGLAVGTRTMYIPVLSMPEDRVIKGPWTVLEGSKLCYGEEPGRPNWAAKYLVERMVDGDETTEWISLWETENTFPMSFVFDLGENCIFKSFKVKDHSTHQGNYRDYEIYVAQEYKGSETEWVMVSKVLRPFSWTATGTVYEFPAQKESIARYLKFVILKAEYPKSGDFKNGRGKLAEIYGIGI